jgi:hypothetical protein
LRAKIHAATRWSIALGVDFDVVDVALAASSGNGGEHGVATSSPLAPWNFALELTHLRGDAATNVHAMRNVNW